MGEVNWPAPIADYLAGRRTRSQLLEAAARSPGRAEERRCEVNFFVGEVELLSDRRETAAEAFRQALRDCPPDFVERDQAAIELDRLVGVAPQR